MEKDSVINPIRGKKSPRLGPVAVITATRADLIALVTAFNLKKEDKKNFLITDLWADESKGIAVAGPFIGSPHAAMVVENLIAFGARKILFSGWCGAVSSDVKTGDIIIPDGAFSDEGTSKHYGDFKGDELLKTSGQLSLALKQSLISKDVAVKEGAIWTTDAIYRETRQKIEQYQKQGVLGVEMELSALIAVCMFRSVEIASVQVVSDEVSSFTWKQGFGTKQFKQSRLIAIEGIAETCMGILDGKS